MYRTAELGLIAALHSLGYPPQEVVKIHDKKVEYIFPTTPELQAIVQGYFDNTLLVQAASYFNSLKLVKEQIYQHVRGSNN